ncbi:MAG TPA: RsmD family RNA methyltransferase [Planctomycetota bacterium]|nr:RsmD family RNA methyltransferase [Planctomycetota bacterium]
MTHPHRINDNQPMESLRIIAGSHKGKRLLAPPGLATRPLPDRIKQSLFDWLGQTMDGLRVVDCCAGSGSFACEAISRGAAQVWAIEPGQHALPILKANAKALGNPANLTIVAQPFEAALPRMHGIDVLFMDPPFPWFSDESETLATLLRLGMACLAPDGRLVVRGERGHQLPPVSGLREAERRLYGRSWVAMLEVVAGGARAVPVKNEHARGSTSTDDQDEDDGDDDEDDDEDDDDDGDEDGDADDDEDDGEDGDEPER